MKKIILVKIFVLYIFSFSHAQLHGFVIDVESGEKLPNVTIKNNNLSKYTYSNNYGYYSITFSKSDVIKFTAIGYEDYKVSIDSINTKLPYEIRMIKKVNNLDEVSVTAESYLTNEEGKIHLSAKIIKQIPMLLGEKDPIKALQFMPGIQEVSEGSSSLSVRGGDVDQNLLLLDEAVVYNANHLFGFFSTFNADPIKSVDAYKSSFPAQFGGRLSSIIDVRMREGNKQKYNVEGGVGLIASRLLVEGPIKKDKSSFLISGRRTYADLLLLPFQSAREKTGYYFWDLNAKFHGVINNKNELFVSGYTGKDSFYQKNKIPRRESFLLNNTNLDWGNITLTTRWNKIYSEKLFHNFSLIYTNYRMQYAESTIQDYLEPPRFEKLSLKSGNSNLSIKLDYDFFKSSNLQIKYGGILTRHLFDPRQFSYISSRNSDDFQNNSTLIRNFEGAGYVNFVSTQKKLFYQAGLRVSYYQKPLYLSPEPRLLLGYNLSKNKIISLSYSKMNQYLHLISNTGNGLPTDVWIPSTEGLKKSTADIFNFSFNAKPSNGINVVFETYYKLIKGNTAYKSGVNFLGVGQGAATTPFKWENSLLQGKSWNYGYELSINKSNGKFTGFGSYTLSWSISKFDELNEGKPFYNRFDRRHIFEATALYSPTKRLTFSSNFILASGNALSVPSGIFFREDQGRNYLEIYSGVNGFRSQNYHRLDIGLILKGKQLKNNWEFSIYNVYNRKNPFNYDTKDKINLAERTQEVSVVKQWLIPFLPSISYNFKF